MVMAVKLNLQAVEHAQALIREGRVVRDERSDWSEHRPGETAEQVYIERHGWAAYGQWHLALDLEEDAETKGHYKFPYGDFVSVHRCGLLAAEARAGQYLYPDITAAAAQLKELLEAPV